MSAAMVIGPTPPGTGVIQPARCAASSYCTSPTSLPSGSRLMPTSITTAPGLTHAPGTNCGLPIAATRMSASPTCRSRSRVWLWHTVIVAAFIRSSSAIGRPTMLLWPTMTAFLPRASRPSRSSIRMIP